MYLNSPNTFFTVYQTITTIELRTGCDDFSGVRVICTTSSYDNARGLAQLAAQMNHLPLIDYVSLEFARLSGGHISSISDDFLAPP